MRLKSIVIDTEQKPAENENIEIRLEKTWTTEGSRIYLSAVKTFWDGLRNTNGERVLHQTWIWGTGRSADHDAANVNDILLAATKNDAAAFNQKNLSLIAEQINRLRTSDDASQTPRAQPAR